MSLKQPTRLLRVLESFNFDVTEVQDTNFICEKDFQVLKNDSPFSEFFRLL